MGVLIYRPGKALRLGAISREVSADREQVQVLRLETLHWEEVKGSCSHWEIEVAQEVGGNWWGFDELELSEQTISRKREGLTEFNTVEIIVSLDKRILMVHEQQQQKA